MNTVSWFFFWVSGLSATFAALWALAGWLGWIAQDWFFHVAYRNAMTVTVVYFICGLASILIGGPQ